MNYNLPQSGEGGTGMKNKKSAVSGGAFSEKLKTSLLAAVFTSYRPHEKPFLRAGGKAGAAADAVSSQIGSSRTSGLLSSFAALLLSLRLRVYGTFIASFGIYTAVFAIIKNFIMSDARMIGDAVFGIVVALSSLPIINSDETLSSALLSSRFGSFVRWLTGIREESMRTETARGRANHGFLFGLAAGIVSFFVTPRAVVLALLGALALWLIMTAPESGVILTAFLIPLVTPVYLTFALGVTTLSFILKLVRGKRYVTLEMLDVSVFAIFLVLMAGSVAPFFGSSLAVSLNMALCLAAYFTAANLMHGKKWISRASSALVTGVAVASAAIIFIKASRYFGLKDLSDGVGILGSSMLRARIAGTDPVCFNMAVCAVFPVALSRFIKPPEGRHRVFSALAMALMLFPLIEYRSVFASLAVAAASMMVLLIYSPRFIWLPLGTAGVGAVVAAFFPAVAERLLSFLGAGYAGFANIRLSAWSDAADILRRTFPGGAGYGAETYAAVSSAHVRGVAFSGHSYNTYLQILIESGVVGFVFFVVFIWLLLTAAFKSFDSLALAKRTDSLILLAPSGKADAFTSEFSVSSRMATAGPLCSVIGLAIFGAGDYIFYDTRIFLTFFLAAGLVAAGVRSTREQVSSLAEDPE